MSRCQQRHQGSGPGTHRPLPGEPDPRASATDSRARPPGIPDTLIDLTWRSFRDINADRRHHPGQLPRRSGRRGDGRLPAVRDDRHPARHRRRRAASGARRPGRAIDPERVLDIAVVAIPKTIDNDLPYTDQSFGFQSAFERATDFIDSVCGRGQRHGERCRDREADGQALRLHRLLRGPLANAADFVLIPEVPFTMDGDDGLLGPGRGATSAPAARGDRRRRGRRAGPPRATGQLGRRTRPTLRATSSSVTSVSSSPRSSPSTSRGSDSPDAALHRPELFHPQVTANAYDSVYCLRLAHAAVHAAMAGRTETVVVRWRRRFVHVPMPLITSTATRSTPTGICGCRCSKRPTRPRFLAG